MTGFSEEPAAYAAKMDKASFLKWIRGHEGPRRELKDGEIVMHPGVSRNHARVQTSFIRLLAGQLNLEEWDVAPGEFAVEIGEDIRYPDVLVERRALDGKALSTLHPVVLIEVLSPSSTGLDLTVKSAEYLGVGSLEAYIVASQDEPICWVWQRTGEGRSFTKVPVEISGRHKVIKLDALGIALPLAEIYRGIGTA